MIFIGQNEPLLFDYENDAVKLIKTAKLKNITTNQELTQVDVFGCKEDCGATEWVAIFDPKYFNETSEYSITWDGTDVNDAVFSYEETGITIKYSSDFYTGFVKTIRQSMFDDGQFCDYHPETMLQAISYANCLINNRPPFTNSDPQCQPCNILQDLTKAYLYKARAGKEAGETFTYNDIGKSFSFDVSGKLIQIAESLERNALQLLDQFKRNFRPALKGLQSRYARRSGRTSRAMFVERSVYRSFIK